MATLDATLAELKGITKALADHAIGTARSPAHSAHGALARLAPPDDFVPAQANAESYAAELVRHKGMLAQQRVGFVPPKADAAKPVAQEPQRTTGLTVATAARTIPSSSIIYVNTKAFNIEACNATNNIKNFMMQVPGRIMSMVRIGTYDDAVRGDHTFSNRYDHLVVLTQRDTPDWDTGDIPWTHNGRAYTVTQAYVDALEARIASANGMKGKPWDSIHPRDVSYPVSPILPEFRDQGCYDKHGPVTISGSKQDVAHNDNLERHDHAAGRSSHPGRSPRA